jgi:type IV pilus assembly PilN-like protein
MTQNINLFDPAFRKQRQLMSFATLAKCLGLTLVVLLGYQFLLQHQIGGLSADLRGVQGLLNEERARAEQLTGRAAARKPDPQLESEIAKLEVELRQAQEAMGALKGGAFGNRQGFADYLRAFSRQSVDGLWLTAFTINGEGELDIRGRALRPDLVPNYIQRLNREKVFAGRSFARFEMSRAEAEPAAKGGKDARAPRFLDFSLATKEAAKKGAP